MLRPASRVVVFPFLASIYPILALYAVNLREMVPPEQMVPPILVAVAATASALALVRVVLGDWARAGILTVLLVILFFTYGTAWEAVMSVLPAGHLSLLALWVALAGVGFLAIRALPPGRLGAVTPILNLTLGVLLVANLMAIVSFQLNMRGDSGGSTPLSPVGGTEPSPADRLPDIYWITLDRYGSEDVVREYYDHDISPFLGDLRDRGFYIAEDATANYLKTAASLVSARNMEYLDGEELRRRATAGDDWSPLYRDLSDSFGLLDVLGPVGYRFIYLGTYWEFTATHPVADVNYVYEGQRGEFATVLADSTLLRATDLLGEDAALDKRRERWRLTRFQWDALNDTIRLRSPKLVHAHFSLPHDPYVFRADGSFVPEELERSRPTAENYADHVEYANAEVLELVDELLAANPDNPPVIVVQGEEGPFPARFRAAQADFRWSDQATDEELHEKFGVLSAFYLPDLPGERAEEAGLYPSITLVNQFRVILNRYLGTQFELLPDRNFIWPDASDLYQFIDVTDRVRRMVERSE